jgi:hypothetical protein
LSGDGKGAAAVGRDDDASIEIGTRVGVRVGCCGGGGGREGTWDEVWFCVCVICVRVQGEIWMWARTRKGKIGSLIWISRLSLE